MFSKAVGPKFRMTFSNLFCFKDISCKGNMVLLELPREASQEVQSLSKGCLLFALFDTSINRYFWLPLFPLMSLSYQPCSPPQHSLLPRFIPFSLVSWSKEFNQGHVCDCRVGTNHWSLVGSSVGTQRKTSIPPFPEPTMSNSSVVRPPSPSSIHALLTKCLSISVFSFVPSCNHGALFTFCLCWWKSCPIEGGT